MSSISKYFIIIGTIFVAVGILFSIFPKLGIFGKLPGDISIEKENFRFYFPIATSIVISILLTLILWLISYFSKK
jgi:Protein of unknown function (DUF2905)